ncbi:hypothetical protein Tco_1211703 [Tanacetum coccineum]
MIHVDIQKSHGDLHNLHNKDIVVEDSVKFAGTHHSIDRSMVPDLELEEYNNDHNEHRSRKYHTILVHSVRDGWENFGNRRKNSESKNRYKLDKFH